jgi:alpha-D-xyloside xylohydrolase
MKRLTLSILLLALTTLSFGQSYQQTANGLKTNLQSMNVEIQFLSPQIVRVVKAPESIVLDKKSLSVVKVAEPVDLKLVKVGDVVTLTSSAVNVDLNLVTGKVGYRDAKGVELFTEKDYGTQFTPTLDVKKNTFTARQAFLLDKDEAIYGLGEQQNGKLMQRGQRIIMKNENMKICIPYFLSLKGYGIFWDNYASTTFTDNVQETSFESLADCSDYYFMYGTTPLGVVSQMRDLTGQAPMFPLWAYGYWQSRERYKTQFELMEVVKKYRALNIPIDGIIQDWQYWGKDSMWNAMAFNPETFPNPKGMVDSVHQLNAHLMIVAWPGFGPQTKQYAEFKSKNMLINFDTWPPNSGTTPYDIYNPKARDIYWDYLNKGVYSLGSDAWWLDSSEPDHINIKESDFDQPTYLGSYRSVVNAFPLLHVEGVYEHQRATTSDKRVCILTRSAFAGQQRFGANSWSGDVGSSWWNLKNQIPAALNFSLSGIPYWNADIGGFFAGRYVRDGGAKNPEFQELYVRWLQFATYTPMMRSHGTDIPREIYQFGKNGDWAYDAIEKNIRLRYSLIPYLYSTAWSVTSASGSILYALPLVFPQDKALRNVTDEFMFGNAFLVAPVINPMYTAKKNGKVTQDFSSVGKRQVQLPKGSAWIDFWTGEKLEGGQELTRETPINITPLYVKAGSIVPWGPDVQYASQKDWSTLEIRVYPGADGSFTLYEDEKDNYNYEKGSFSTIAFTWNETAKTLTIGDLKGSFKGMLKNRKFQVVLVTPSSNTAEKGVAKSSKTVAYSGKTKTIKL